MLENIPHISVNRFSLCYEVSVLATIDRKHQPIWVSVLVSDLNQNSGFGCTLQGSPLSTIFGTWKKLYNAKFVLVGTT
jgi:hypothetical protein